MARRSTCLKAAAALAMVVALAPGASAQGCRARDIMTSQCTWFALEELKGDRQEAARAEREATSDLIGGCSSGEYQMVLLRGNGLADEVTSRLRSRGTRNAAAVRDACRAAAGAISQR